MKFIPFIHRLVKKKEKQLEQLPLYIEEYPLPDPNKKLDIDVSVIIIDLG